MPLCGLASLDGTNESTFLEEVLRSLDNKGISKPMGMPIIAAIVAEALKNKRPPPQGGFSASQIQGCLRKIMLDAQVDYVTTAHDQLRLVHGTLIHQALESAFGALSPLPLWFKHCFVMEQRLFSTIDTPLGTIPFHGQFDLLYLPPHDAAWKDLPKGMRQYFPFEPMLYDHKTTSKVPTQPKAEHIWQCSIYAYLVHCSGFWEAPKKAEINYIDMSKNVAFQVELYDLIETQEYIEEKLAALAPSYFDGLLPKRVEAPGRWQCGLNRNHKPYCAHSALCWPQGIGHLLDGCDVLDFMPLRSMDQAYLDELKKVS